MCVKHTHIFLGCSAFTQLHPQGKMRFQEVKDQPRTACAHHSNGASETETSDQIMSEMTNADDYFKPPVGRKTEEKNVLSQVQSKSEM